MSASFSLKKLPKPKPKELRKLKQSFTDLINTCLQAGNLYLKAYYAKDLNRLKYSKMIFWASFVSNLLKDFIKDFVKTCQELGINKELQS